MALDKVLYSAHATSTGGREGRATTSDGSLDVQLTMPPGLGGKGEPGVNPEQLFAAGYSACFLGALKYNARLQKMALPDNTSVHAQVDIGTVPDGLALAVAMKIEAPGMDAADLKKLVDIAHGSCPYSKATRGNIDVSFTLG
jgi:osmotically inducible protein OsmC